LMTGRNRISRCLGEFHYSSTTPDSHCIKLPLVRGNELIPFVETRTLQTPSLSGLRVNWRDTSVPRISWDGFPFECGIVLSLKTLSIIGWF
jgi:hypothetical protein